MRNPLASIRAREWILVGLWLLGTAGGLAGLARYKGEPGPPAGPPLRWPEGSTLARDPRLPTLVLLAHPKCPCTRASLEELRGLLGTLRGRVAAHALFLCPPGLPESWSHTPSWEEAASISGLDVALDRDGAEASRFGARTSGQVLIYGPEGALRFAGGITGARGHLGPNRGLGEVASILRTGSCEGASSPVYGCPLEDPREPR